MSFEIWAKGNNVRSEMSVGDEKLIILQLGDTIYTFGADSKQGNTTRFESGLASHGLLEQIALVKSEGKPGNSQTVDGVTFDEYSYDVDAPQEVTRALLEAKTFLPKDWVSIVKNGDADPVAARTIFRDMEANVDVPDEFFELPRGVEFTEVTAAELLATPLPDRVRRPPPAKLESLHGTLIINQQEEKPLEIWAQGDNVRAVSSSGDRKVINIQRGGVVYTIPEGSTTGTKRRVDSKLRSLGLIPRIAEVLAHGKKVESLTIEGAPHDKYSYDLDAPAETSVVYLLSDSSLPGLWIYTITSGGQKSMIVEQYRNLEANPDIPSDLFELPSNVDFSKAAQGPDSKRPTSQSP
jgi:outer membrane lipoprotein-sorting protein